MAALKLLAGEPNESKMREKRIPSLPCESLTRDVIKMKAEDDINGMFRQIVLSVRSHAKLFGFPPTPKK